MVSVILGVLDPQSRRELLLLLMHIGPLIYPHFPLRESTAPFSWDSKAPARLPRSLLPSYRSWTSVTTHHGLHLTFSLTLSMLLPSREGASVRSAWDCAICLPLCSHCLAPYLQHSSWTPANLTVFTEYKNGLHTMRVHLCTD